MNVANRCERDKLLTSDLVLTVFGIFEVVDVFVVFEVFKVFKVFKVDFVLTLF
jgi:hypothetical protein